MKSDPVTIAAFTCGHTAPVPINFFGRGAARVRRMGEYYGRRCCVCRCAAYRGTIKTYTKPPSATSIQNIINGIIREYALPDRSEAITLPERRIIN